MHNKAWLNPNSPAHETLKCILFDKKLLQDIQKLTEFCNTGELKSYHSLLTKYCPKRQHFSSHGMVIQTMLAILDHNYNVDRPQATKTGDARFKLVFPKFKKTWISKPIAEKKDYTFRHDILARIIDAKGNEGSLTNLPTPTTSSQNIASQPCPLKDTLID